MTLFNFEHAKRGADRYSPRRMDGTDSPASFSADLCGCAALPVLAVDEVAELFIAALGRAGATIVDTVSHLFPRTGLTCVLILSESHAVLHTWPETGTINIDIFSCTPRLRSLEAINELGRSFGAQQIAIQEIARASGHGQRLRAG
jgi:S-adenosylmethionine decarboxylase